MLRASQILASRVALAASLLALVALAACGQRGPLFLPSDVPASARATLPQTLRLGAAPEPQPSAPTPAFIASPAPPFSVPAAPSAAPYSTPAAP